MVREHETEPDSGAGGAPAGEPDQVAPASNAEVAELRVRELHLNERADALQRELEHLRGEASRYTTRVAVLQDRDDRWAERFEKLQLAHDRTASELAALRADARVVIQERDDRDRLLEQVQDSYDAATAQVAELTSQLTELRATAGALAQERDARDRLLEEFRKERDHDVQELRAANAATTAELSALASQHAAATAELAELRATASLLAQERDDRDERLSEARARATEAEARANAAQDRVVALGNLPIEVEVGLRNQIDAAQAEVHRVRLELLDRARERDEERDRAARLKARTEKLASRLEVRDGQVAKLEKRLATVRARLDERTEQLRTVNQSRGYRLLRLSWRVRQRVRHPRGVASAQKALPAPSDPAGERPLRLVAGQPDARTQETPEPGAMQQRSS